MPVRDVMTAILRVFSAGAAYAPVTEAKANRAAKNKEKAMGTNLTLMVFM
jgi:hypothetical protein